MLCLDEDDQGKMVLEAVTHSDAQRMSLCPEEKGRFLGGCLINFVLSRSLSAEKLGENGSGLGDSVCQSVEV